MKVLIIDDSEFAVKQLTKILEGGGHEVVGIAKDGLEGVAKFKELNPDITMLDVTMPKIDGLAALAEIIRHDPGAKVLMVSALGKKELIKKSLLIGAKSYIIKPLDKKKVLDRISQAASK